MSAPFRWSGQVITFYHPDYWGQSDDAAVSALAERSPRESHRPLHH